MAKVSNLAELASMLSSMNGVATSKGPEYLNDLMSIVSPKELRDSAAPHAAQITFLYMIKDWNSKLHKDNNKNVTNP